MDEDWFQVTFVYRRGDAQNVFLTGDFCGWSTAKNESLRMQPCKEGFSLVVPLLEGSYHYKFLVDGEWRTDEWNPHRDANCFGNSIIFVHMDPNVHGLRPQNPPFREYHRPHCDDSHFHVHCPQVPEHIRKWGVLQRQLYVDLPPSYKSNAAAHYPVVYAFDGQNVFSTPGHCGGPAHGGLFLDEKLDHFWSMGLLPEFILVAIPNVDFVCIGNRKREYCSAVIADTARSPFVLYMLEVVKSLIEGTYRVVSVPEKTVLLGASMGGLLAFCMAYTLSHVFGRAVCLSPSFWYVDKTGSTAYDLVKSSTSNCKFYLDSGDAEGDNMHETKWMAETLELNGWQKGTDYEYFLDKGSSCRYDGATHSEHVWKERILQALKFVFN